MRNLKLLTLLGMCLMIAPYANAQRFGVEIGVGPVYEGPPPVCEYGYYDYYPYGCAPYGYYGPEWFSGGVFIGAGPWFHGGNGFRGYRDFHADRGHVDRGRAFTGNREFRGDDHRGAVRGNARGFTGGNNRGYTRSFNGGNARGGESRGGNSFHGGGSSHGGGGSRGGGNSHGGGRR